MSNRETELNLPKTEMYYFDEENGTYKPLATAGAIPVIVIGGNVGTGGSAMNFLSGSGVPSNDVGVNGDVYLNSVNGDLYKKGESTWSVIANLKGLKGDTGSIGTTGVAGATWLLGASAPTNNQGKSGDLYLNTSTFDVYSKATGTWVLSGNIKGATGATGTNGINGTNGAKGADGATWLFGVIAPTTQGKTGDFYLDAITGNVYSKATGAWVASGNIKGVKGDTGNTWASGAVAPTTQGSDGDLYLNTSTFDVYIKSNGSWVLVGNIKGATGANGFGTVAQYNDIIARLEALETPTP